MAIKQVTGWFVYVKRNGRITCQRFDTWPTDSATGKRMEVLQSQPLNKLDMHCRLDFLRKKFPYTGSDV